MATSAFIDAPHDRPSPNTRQAGSLPPLAGKASCLQAAILQRSWPAHAHPCLRTPGVTSTTWSASHSPGSTARHPVSADTHPGGSRLSLETLPATDYAPDDHGALLLILHATISTPAHDHSVRLCQSNKLFTQRHGSRSDHPNRRRMGRLLLRPSDKNTRPQCQNGVTYVPEQLCNLSPRSVQ